MQPIKLNPSAVEAAKTRVAELRNTQQTALTAARENELVAANAAREAGMLLMEIEASVPKPAFHEMQLELGLESGERVKLAAIAKKHPEPVTDWSDALRVVRKLLPDDEATAPALPGFSKQKPGPSLFVTVWVSRFIARWKDVLERHPISTWSDDLRANVKKSVRPIWELYEGL
jgi:hypothetical protein